MLLSRYFLGSFLGFVFVAFGCLSLINGDEQCQSIIQTASQSMFCDSLGNCTGLQCMNASSGLSTSFTLDKCQDPLLVTLTLVSNNQTILYDMYNASTTIMVNNNVMIKLNISRNYTYAWIKVDSVGGWSVIPVTTVPLNTTDCMCQSIQNIIDSVQVPFEFNCVNNSECSGLQCSFSISEVTYSAETEVLPCADPPGFDLIIRRVNDRQILYQHFYNSSENSTIPLIGVPIHVTIVHRQYSMFIEVDVIVGGQKYALVPYSQIILDKTSCLPDMPVQPEASSSVILSSTAASIPVISPTPIYISSATCDTIKEIAENSLGGIAVCQSNENDGCDTVSCSLFGYVSKTQILPCHDPPGFHVTITDPSGNVLYDNDITNTTNVHISGFTITFTIDHNVPNAIGLKVSYSTPFGAIGDIIPHTEIPIDRCLCNNPVITSDCGVSMSMTTTTSMFITSTLPLTTFIPVRTSVLQTTVKATTSTTTTTTTGISTTLFLTLTPTAQTGSNTSYIAVAVSVPLVIVVFIAIVALLIVIGVIFIMFKHRGWRISFNNDKVLLTDVAEENEDL